MRVTPGGYTVGIFQAGNTVGHDWSGTNVIITSGPDTGNGIRWTTASGTSQTDTIVLDSNVTAGSWYVGAQGPVAWNDTAANVKTAIENYLSISGGSCSAGTLSWAYTYGSVGNQSANTSLLETACNGGNNALTQPVAVTVTTTQVGG